jgi:hypothetical protein
MRTLAAKPCGGRTWPALYSVFNELFLAASAEAIMNESETRRKVGCHTGGLCKIWAQKHGTLGLALDQGSRSPEEFGTVGSHLSQRTRKMLDPAGRSPVELVELDAALKRRSSTAVHVFVISAERCTTISRWLIRGSGLPGRRGGLLMVLRGRQRWSARCCCFARSGSAAGPRCFLPCRIRNRL